MIYNERFYADRFYLFFSAISSIPRVELNEDHSIDLSSLLLLLLLEGQDFYRLNTSYNAMLNLS